ncbi:hypothetical protein EDC42_1833 [Methanobrevibacter gottschalkii DSM 11977]|uniref:Tetratricopeptide repeat protein n=1 Tax=Methanobrevibacter gottschalkii DSM 11977 TaxID=1122229 RepID=A0A3N5AYZ3_9EURY|nr:hypothetical protein EDC42_1833 [Methanobrevibacter gottschalkii DSM 11977]
MISIFHLFFKKTIYSSLILNLIGDILNFKFKECKTEFDGGNFEEALDILGEIENDDEDYKFALMLKYNCLMGLGCYGDALTIINMLIHENPYMSLFWFDKVKCHYFLKDLTNAAGALYHVEHIIDLKDVVEIIDFVKLCNMIGEHVIALKYCNIVLDTDENQIDALLEKSLISNIIDDKNMMNECGDKLFELSGDNLSLLMVSFALKLFSGMYRDSFNIILNINCMDSKMGLILKKIIYNQMLCDLNIQIVMESNAELTIDEFILLLFDYRYYGVESGEVKNVRYMIVKQD